MIIIQLSGLVNFFFRILSPSAERDIFLPTSYDLVPAGGVYLR